MKSGVVLVDFWAEWCAPCRRLAPTVDQLAEDYNGRVTVAKMNIDDNPDTPTRFMVRGIPDAAAVQGRRVEGNHRRAGRQGGSRSASSTSTSARRRRSLRSRHRRMRTRASGHRHRVRSGRSDGRALRGARQSQSARHRRHRGRRAADADDDGRELARVIATASWVRI